MRFCPPVTFLLVVAAVAGCRPHTAATTAHASRSVDVHLDAGEADAALTIVDRRAAGGVPTEAEWAMLFISAGYMRLKEREAAIGRPFSDSSFAAFITSDSLDRRAPSLDHALPALKRLDVSSAAARALKYLPEGAALRARLYLEIKPVTNSFVFTGRDSTPSIFLYVDPRVTPAQLENTVTHELHHIGLNAACPDQAFARGTEAEGMLMRFLGAFGEGQAMLAAAGSPDVNPHAANDDTIQSRWNRDVGRANADIAELSGFFSAVLDGKISSADSVRRRASTYFGVQGPWYTVGWLMASTVERELGRDTLIGALCDPVRFISLYNGAARRANARGAALPLWDEGLVTRLEAARRAIM